MSITDELRKEARGHLRYLYTSGQAKHLLAIADRIDKEHAEAQRRWMAELDAARDRDGFIELPKDADGEYIHIGDWMENGERVERIVLTDGSWEPYVYLAKTPHVLHEYFCNEISHYHEPTVEDVLTDLCEHVWESALLGSTWSDSPVESYITEYAAKMRLAGEGE